MHLDRRLIAVTLLAGVIAGCGSDSGGAATTQPSTSSAPATTTSTAGASSTVAPSTAPATTAPATTAPATTAPAITVPPTTVPPTTGPATSTTVIVPTQLALWPAPDVVLATPEAAAADFIANAFGPGPVLGAFQAGDERSGEIAVFAADESGAALGTVRSTLLLRRLGPADGWFVIGAVSDVSVIATPEAGSAVPAAPLTVTGSAEGFEANIGVKAFVVGHADPPLDVTSTLAGNFGVPLPYDVTLDLSGASPGDIVVILVHGGAGLETDPGNFAAIAVTITA